MGSLGGRWVVWVVLVWFGVWVDGVVGVVRVQIGKCHLKEEQKKEGEVKPDQRGW